MKSVITINAEICTGCQMCEVSCSLRNMGECNPERSRIRVIKDERDGQLSFLPSTCMQCETAMCELVCPMQAISRDPETGARLVNEDKCVGCSSCSYACPFGACYVDRRLGKSVVCVQCDGDPTCVKVCPSGALNYVPYDQVNISLKRAKAEKIRQAKAVAKE
jgi:carbon-monoxide dehydrogenase iron sulfur subunit